jgi:hypothetical protein
MSDAVLAIVLDRRRRRSRPRWPLSDAVFAVHGLTLTWWGFSTEEPTEGKKEQKKFA